MTMHPAINSFPVITIPPAPIAGTLPAVMYSMEVLMPVPIIKASLTQTLPGLLPRRLMLGWMWRHGMDWSALLLTISAGTGKAFWQQEAEAYLR